MVNKKAFAVINNKVVEDIFPIEDWSTGNSYDVRSKNLESLSKVLSSQYESNVIEINSKDKSYSKYSIDSLSYNNTPVLEAIKATINVSENSALSNQLDAEALLDGVEKSTIAEFNYLGKQLSSRYKEIIYTHLYCVAMDQAFPTMKYLENVWYTDLDYNYNTNDNCQARAFTFMQLLIKNNKTDLLQNFEEFTNYYSENVTHYKPESNILKQQEIIIPDDIQATFTTIASKMQDESIELIAERSKLELEAQNDANDTSENSGLQAVNQKIQTLVAEINSINSKIDNIKNIQNTRLNLLSTEMICFGCVVKLSNGLIVYITDVFEDKYIKDNFLMLDINTKIMDEIIGKRAGETIRLNNTEYKIEVIT